ncbi:MAG TPA: hypothetical protein VEU97_15520 [Ktedonobacteraceae bacterium]|nr:hypothetical protein [Ktedonobacteraceae bacterium]
MEEVEMFDYSYPKVKQSLGRAALQDSHPALLLDPRGVIRGANLMAFWLFGALRSGEPINPASLLGMSVFTLMVGNFERIPVELNDEFYTKRSALVKRVDANLHSPLYAPFISAMQADPQRAQIYARARAIVDHEWEYTLRIAPPGSQEPGEYLEFRVTNFHVEGNRGFLFMYDPLTHSQPVIEEQYGQLMDIYNENVYMLPENEAQDDVVGNQPQVDMKNYERPYYPVLLQDPLWYIIGENKSQQLLIGQSAVGAHFFEVYFAPQLHEWIGPLHETSAPRAIRYFDIFTAKFLHEDHELHAAYVQLMQRLVQLPAFVDLLDIARKLNIRINLPSDVDVAFYSCRVILPWPFFPRISMQFRSMVRFLHKGLLVTPAERYYHETLVPENYTTEAALILLHLFSPAPVMNDSDSPSFQQMLWGLAIMQTVRQGLLKKDEQDKQWGPEAAFDGIYNELLEEYSQRKADAVREVTARLRVIIETLDQQSLVDKETLLSMLQSFTITQPSLDHLNAFCTEELEILTSVTAESSAVSKVF